MLRGIWGDPERYVETYWSRFPGRYFAGDGAKLDDDGYLWLLGRVDDVMNVSGHRISTTEVESALVSHPSVAEAAVVGANDATTGQAIIAYVILRGGADVGVDELRDHVGGRDRRARQAEDDLHDARPPQDPHRARSCAVSCAMWPRDATSATPRPSPTSPWSMSCNAGRKRATATSEGTVGAAAWDAGAASGGPWCARCVCRGSSSGQAAPMNDS